MGLGKIFNPLNSINEKESSICLDINIGKDIPYRYFTEFTMRTSIDSFDQISVSIPFMGIKSKEERRGINVFYDRFRPLSYGRCTVFYGKEPLMDGIVMASNPKVSTKERIIDVNISPKCAVLNDVCVPKSLYPCQFQNSSLETIANRLTNAFDIISIFKTPSGAPFKRVAPKPQQNIFSFLIELAKGRGLIISNGETGDLVFSKANVFEPSESDIEETSPPFLRCEVNFNAQKYYSEITGLTPTDKDEQKSSLSYTWINPFLTGIKRPYTYISDANSQGDLKTDVERTAAAMFAEACSYILELQGHKNSKGNFYKKNTLINVTAPHSAILKKTEFLISEATLSRSISGGDKTTLILVLPRSFSGTLPKTVPWIL